MSNQSRRVNQFFANLIAKIRKLLIKMGSPFRISRRTVRMLQNQSRSSQAGFVLPTVTLVTVVVTLLVVTMVARSSDRARSASNARVEQVFDNSAKPAVDRARAKIEALFNDSSLPRTTPPEDKLIEVISSSDYTFDDETRLQINYDFLKVSPSVPSALPTAITPDSTINTVNNKLINREFVNTAWKFPIDTDNNGKYDSIGLYSILFRTRPAFNSSDSRTKIPLTPLEARALPLDESVLSDVCTGSTFANVATDEGWINNGQKLRKSFFVYAVTIPVTDLTPYASLPNTQKVRYEEFAGNKAFKGLELQQDRARNPKNNNAVWFEQDLELASVANFRVNGRIYTGANLMVGAFKNDPSAPVTFYQVSSTGSCYYKEENSKIIVAGNVVLGDATAKGTSGDGLNRVGIHLFLQNKVDPTTNVKFVDPTNRTVNNDGQDAASNDFAYSKRVTALVEAALDRSTLTVNTTPVPIGVSNLVYAPSTAFDPVVVQKDIIKRINDEGLSGAESYNLARRKSFELYFAERTRKVPFIEVPATNTDAQIFGTEYNNPSYQTSGKFNKTLFTSIPINPNPVGSGDTFELSPPLEWMMPFDANGGSFTSATNIYNSALDGKGLLSGTSTNSLILNAASPLVKLSTTDPIKEKTTQEQFLGDRILAGNNLPARWLKKDGTTKKFATIKDESKFTKDGSIKFNKTETAADDLERIRNTQARTLESLGVSDRGGFWELSAADDPASSGTPAVVSPVTVPQTGGLRVITNAGIYSRQPNPSIGTGTFLSRFVTGIPNQSTNVADNLLNPLSIGLDESLVDESGMPRNDPATAIDERLFNGNTDATKFVVWSDSMPMTGSVRWDTVASVYRPWLAYGNDYNNDGIRNTGENSVNAIGLPFSLLLPTPANNELTPRWATSADPVTIPTPQLIRNQTCTTNPEKCILNPDNRKGDLQMRATAVYHYKYSAFDPADLSGAKYQKPVACVSSYYDPSNSSTARNSNGLPWNNNLLGRSNNGIVYKVASTASNITVNATYNNTTGIFSGYDAGAINPYNGTIDLGDRLAYQANLIFPNGRFANEPLRNVLLKIKGDGGSGPGSGSGISAANARLTLPEQSTLDSNICALEIMQIGGTPLTVASGALPKENGIEIPHGSFREAAFLDGREVKALNRNENLTEAANGLNGTQGLALADKNRADIYDLEIEQRQPLEIRVTDIDMDRLRGSKAIGSINSGVATDFLLPYSGLVYASRDDALRDQSYFDLDASTNPTVTESSKRNLLSATDFRLDPTRRPNGIRLINGVRLWRGKLDSSKLDNDTNVTKVASGDTSTYNSSLFNPAEKGLILVSNLPVYVKAQVDPSDATKVGFNIHTKEEFKTKLNTASGNEWNNFYTRINTDLDPDFACRPGDPTNAKCLNGDEWRPATIFADSPIALSAAFRDGFRSDGDYDLANNANTSSSINWQSSLSPNDQKAKDSQYLKQRQRLGFYNNSFVTSSNYLPPSTSASSSDGSNLFPDTNRSSYNANGVTPIQRRVGFGEYNMEICRKLSIEECGLNDWVKAGAGTSALPSRSGSFITPGPLNPAPRFIATDDEKFPRRVSFLRYDDIYADGNEALVMVQGCPNGASVWPIPIAVFNGNANTGYTYPQTLGNLTNPYKTSNRNSYGDVACPPPTGASIQINSDFSGAEGRNRDNVTGLSLTAPSVNSGNFATVTTSAGTNTNTEAYSRFPFTVAVTNLANALGTVSAGIEIQPQLAPSASLARVGSAGFLITASNTPINDFALTDVLGQVFVDSPSTCRDSSGNLVAAGTAITQVFFRTTDTPTCNVVALVTRDVIEESNETFNIRLTTINNAASGTISRTGTITQTATGFNDVDALPPIDDCPSQPLDQIISSTQTFSDDGVVTNRKIRRGRIICPTPTPTPTPPTPTPPTPTPTPTPPTPTPTPTPPTPPTPTPTPTPTPPAPTPGGGSTMLPPPIFGLLHSPTISFRYSGMVGSALLPNLPLAAAYPYPTGTYPAADCGSTTFDNVTNSYTCNTRTTPPSKFSGESIFGAGRQIPFKPRNASGSGDGFAPMLPGMNNNLPNERSGGSDAPRALWFRTSQDDGNYIGEGANLRYDTGKNLYIYNQSWPQIGGGAVKANLNTGRLVLPDTVCIDTADGSVDPLCLKQGVTTTLINLNLPLNPQFPSDASSNIGVSGVAPASSYAVCGVNGNSQNFQTTEAFGLFGITNGSCPTNPRGAIATAMGTTTQSFRNSSLKPDDALNFKGQGSILPAFVSPPPIIKAIDQSTPTPETRLITVTAANTFALNKVNVINLTGLYGHQLTANSSVGETIRTISDITAVDANQDSIAWKTACTAPTNSYNRVTGTLRLKANPNQPSPVFILRSCENQNLLLDNFKLQLDGVEPNNVFWVVPRTNPLSPISAEALTIQGDGGTATGSTVVSGNFLGIMPSTGTPLDRTQATTLNIVNTATTTPTPTPTSSAGINVALRSTRFLGFRALSVNASPAPSVEGGKGVDTQAMVAAMTTTNQPIVLPVLQIHSPVATSAGGGTTMPQPTAIATDNTMNGNTVGPWTQRAGNSEINVYFVAGNTPSRSKAGYRTSITSTTPNNPISTAETGGGLQNFIRLLENWTQRNLKIVGGFIQNAKSSFGTAPFSVTAPFTDAADSFNTSDIQTLFINPADAPSANQPLSKFSKFYQSQTGLRIPYFRPPNRLWGFDVGLLTQPSDRFAERFASPIAGANEFLREIDKEDLWIKTMLCAAQPKFTGTQATDDLLKKGTTPKNYLDYALGVKDRPADCSTKSPLFYD